MSVGASSAQAGRLPQSRSASRATAVSADAIALAGLAALSLVLAVVTWNTWGDLRLDTGYDLVAGAGVSHAELPYLDFLYYYGPLGPVLLGGVFEILGINVGASVALGLVLAIAVIGMTYAVGRTLLPPLPAALAAALAAVPAFSNSNVSYVQPHSLSAPLGMLLCLTAILTVARFIRTGGTRWLVATAFAIGLTALTRPESIGALALAIGTWFVVRAVLAEPGDRGSLVRQALLLTGISVGIAVAGYGAFFVVGTFHRSLTLDSLIHENILPRGLLRDSVAVVYDQVAPKTFSSFVALAGRAVLYAAGAGAVLLAATAVARGGRMRSLAIAVVVIACAGFLAILLARPEALRHAFKFVFGWLPAGAAVGAAGLVAVAVRRRRWEREDQIALLVCVLLFVFTITAYAELFPYPNPDFPQESAYAMPLIGIFLAWVHVRVLPRLSPSSAGAVRAIGVTWIALLAIGCAGLLVHDAREETVTVSASHGSMRAVPRDGVAYQQVVDTIERQTRPGDPILLAPQMTALYVMTGRHDPLAQLTLLPGSLDGAVQEQKAIDVLDASGVRLVITDRDPLTRYAHGAFGTGYARILGTWIRENFKRTAVLRGAATKDEQRRTLDVWQRRT